MSLFTHIKSCWQRSNNIAPPAPSVERQGIEEKERLRLQICYERWAAKPFWELKKEGMPLLFGIDPECSASISDTLSQRMQEQWQHACNCVEQGLLAVKNQSADPVHWQVKPLDLYRWAAVSRLPLPQVFVALMEFIATTVKHNDEQDTSMGANTARQADHFLQQQNALLGGAFALLANCPERCRMGEDGKIMASKILQQLHADSEFWLADIKMTLTMDAQHDLLAKYLHKYPVDH